MGDIDALREIDLPVLQDNPCSVNLMELGRFTDMIAASYEKTWREWQAAAERALINNPSSFAVLSLDELLKTDGMLNLLRAKGYTVIEPW
jgi:hypothetical protein